MEITNVKIDETIKNELRKRNDDIYGVALVGSGKDIEVVFGGSILKETDKAIEVIPIVTSLNDKTVWIPKSRVVTTKDYEGVRYFKIPYNLFISKDLHKRYAYQLKIRYGDRKF